ARRFARRRLAVYFGPAAPHARYIFGCTWGEVRMRKLQFAALAAAVALVPALAFANAVTVTKTGKSGQPIGLIYIFNCQNHLLPGSAYGSALHGKVTVNKTTRDVCFGKAEPVLEFIY